MATERYAAFLRGVSPVNLKMTELKSVLEATGFSRVKTVLASGNAVFDARPTAVESLERKLEKAFSVALGRSFFTIVRPIAELQRLLEDDPFATLRLASGSKRVVTFLRNPPKTKPSLPISLDGAHILALVGGEAFSAYVPSPRGPVFMTLIKKTFGENVTTRTWDTIKKVAKA